MYRIPDHGQSLVDLDSQGIYYTHLVGGFNPFEKYARQIGSFPHKSGCKFQKCFKPPPT